MRTGWQPKEKNISETVKFMRVLIINKFLYPKGGAETYFLKIGEFLKDHGHAVSYFGMTDARNTVGNEEGFYTGNIDFHTRSFKKFFYPFRIIYSVEARRKLGRLIESFKPDIIHLNNINFQLTPSIIDEAKKRGVPVVWTLHDFQLVCPNHLLYNKGEVCEKCVKGAKGNCIRGRCIHGSAARSIVGVWEAHFYGIKKTYKYVSRFICPGKFLEEKVSCHDCVAGKTVFLRNFSEKFEKN